MDQELMKVLIQRGVIDFDKLVLQEYQSLNLSEREAMLIIHLQKESRLGQNRLQVDKLAALFNISSDEVYTLLDRLLQGQYLTMSLVKNEEGKEIEVYSVDNTAAKMIAQIAKQIEYNKTKESKVYATPEEAVVDLLEENFQKQLTPLEIEMIQRWFNEMHYDLMEIKKAVYDSVKSNKLSVSHVDSVLLKRQKKSNKNMKLQEPAATPEALKSFFDLWKKD